MLKLPAYLEDRDSGATVFQDDKEFWRFYILPGFPTVRVDDKGDPVFLLVKYDLSDESRQNDPTLPRGGGYLVFDSELRVSQDTQDKIAAKLQDYVNAEYDRRKQLEDAAKADPNRHIGISGTFTDPITPGHGVPTGDQILGGGIQIPVNPGAPLPDQAPKVVFGEPLWKSGKVHMEAPGAPGLVRSKSGDTPASLLGDNVAAFSMDLTEDGASFMQQTLVGSGGTGATDLTPIQIVYTLTMLAKLPPAKAYVHIDMVNMFHSVNELVHTYQWHAGCDPNEYNTVQNKLQVAIDAGFITIKIDAGGVTDEDVIKHMEQQAQALVQQILADRFVKKDDQSGSSGNKDGGDDQNKDKDVTEESANIYRLKRETEISLEDVTETFDLEPTIEYTVSPQGTLQTFLKGRNTAPFVRTVKLDDDFFKTLQLNVRAFANWDTDQIAFADVEVNYPASGGADLKVGSFTFSSASKDAQKWDPSLIGKSREYRYRTRVTFKGKDAGQWSDWKNETTHDLNIAVATPGKLDIEVISAGVDWDNTVALALVYLHYEDPANGIPVLERTIALNAAKPSDTWTQLLYTKNVNQLSYRTDYILKPAGIVSTTAQRTASSKIVVSDPSANRLLVTLLPDGVWDNVAHCAVTVSYADSSGYHVDQQYDLKYTDFRQWKVVLKDVNATAFKVSYIATFNNGTPSEQVGPLALTGSQVVPIKVSIPYVKVTASAAVVDWTQIQLVEVDFDHPDGSSSVQLKSDKAVDSWTQQIKDPNAKEYGYTVTYYPVKGLGDPVRRERQTSTSDKLIIQPYNIPKVGAQVIAKTIDFNATPVVLVQFSYGDQQGETLSFTDGTTQQWFLPVPDSASREYQYQVTYTVLNKDGTTSTVARAAVTTTADKIVLDRYKAG